MMIAEVTRLDIAFTWIISVIILGLIGYLVYVSGELKGFTDGWDKASEIILANHKSRADLMDRLYKECQAQRDAAHADLAAAHVERDRLTAEVALLSADISRLSGGIDKATAERLRVSAGLIKSWAGTMGGLLAVDGGADIDDEIDDDLDDEDELICPDCGEDFMGCECELDDLDDLNDLDDDDKLICPDCGKYIYACPC